jgi:spore coat polysaccharide biosynthesis protein SpsF (cytidylyltransferase family)
MKAVRWGVVIQARLGSTRLPGKVLEDLGGLPMVERIWRQVFAARPGLVPVLSTSLDAKDDRLCDFAASLGWVVSRGPADDIIGRMQDASVKAQVDAIVRVWGDCPFVCPDIIEAMIVRFETEGLEFLTNGTESRTLPIGLDAELYGADLLKRSASEVSDIFLREFPVQFAMKTVDPLKRGVFNPPSDFPLTHLTVDYPEDLAAARAIYKKLSPLNETFTSAELFHILSIEPALIELFAHRPRQADFAEKLTQFKKRTSGN